MDVESSPDCSVLPLDVLKLVLEFLQVEDLSAAGAVSREWRIVASEADGAWRNSFVADFGELKGGDYRQLRSWRDKYIACRLDMVWHKLRSKARYVDEMEDSAALLEKNAQAVLKRLGQMDRTLAHRRHDLSVQLAALSGHPATHMDSPRGQELLELAGAGGDLAACPRLTPDAAAALLDMQRDVEFWKGSIAQERDALHRMWDSLSYIQTCIKKARADIGDLQRRKAALELATLWRPAVRRT